MLKSLYPEVDWGKIKFVGFDLDGTLYDEFDFIDQAYQPVAARLAADCRTPATSIHRALLDRWLQVGSSYPHIFEEVFEATGIEKERQLRAVGDCLELFRATQPGLSLSARVAHLLEVLSQQYELFLVSDGQGRLQRAKIAALGLGRWFKPGNIAVSGEHGAEFQKPSTRMTTKLEVLAQSHAASSVVYFGDRQVDQQFAANAGFDFIGVHCMNVSPLRL